MFINEPFYWGESSAEFDECLAWGHRGPLSWWLGNHACSKSDIEFLGMIHQWWWYVLYVYQWYYYYKMFGHVLEAMTWNVSLVSCIAGAISVPHKRLHLVSWVGIHYLEVGSTTKRKRLELWWWWYICWQVRVMLTPLYLQHIQHATHLIQGLHLLLRPDHPVRVTLRYMSVS